MKPFFRNVDIVKCCCVLAWFAGPSTMGALWVGYLCGPTFGMFMFPLMIAACWIIFPVTVILTVPRDGGTLDYLWLVLVWPFKVVTEPAADAEKERANPTRSRP